MVDVMDEVYVIPPEEVDAQVKEEAESKVVPTGTWEGTVVSYYLIDEPTEFDKQKFGSAPIYRVGVTCYDCPTVGEKRTGWVKMTPIKVLGEKGKAVAPYNAMIGLTNATNTKGQTITDTFEQAKVTRCRYRMEQWFDNADTEKKLPKGNWCKSVGPVR